MDLQASLAVGLNNITKTFGCVDFENIPMAVHSSENLSRTNKDLINYCYTFGFEVGGFNISTVIIRFKFYEFIMAYN